MLRDRGSSGIGDGRAHVRCAFVAAGNEGDLMQFDLNFERDEVYECGAVLLAVLACPGAEEL